ncbi:MAG: hypothetical protein GC168_04785 [Candidatus Hydrogenedens sp.]|nr:hypothetical protein [Candidatus Hydrogenedens sp.]
MPDGEGGGEGASIICDNQEVASGSFAGCQTNTLSSQRPAPELDPDSGFYGSDLAFSSGAGDYRADEFEGATGAIQSVRWWGTTLQFGFPCTRDAGEFLIRFYSDTPNGTNSPDFEQSVSPVITSTNATANSFPVFQYEANLNTPVNMESGWLSIVASGDDDCFFYWYRSDEGNKTHTRIQGTSASFGGGDFGYCLMACPLPAPEGEPDGEGMTEGVVDGEGGSEGQPEGSVEGSPEGGTEGDPEGTVEGSTEGTTEGTMDGEAELQYPPIDQCASDSIGGQRPYGLDPVLSGFYFSDVINNDFRIETFSGINQPIGGVRWWGTSITPSFINCDRTSARFRVSFFESGTLPGEVLDSFDVTAVRTNTGAVYAGRPVYRLEAVFPRTVNVSSGWVAIAGIEDFGCLAYWYRSDQGDTDHVRVSNGEFSGASGDMSYCFLPEGFVLEGEGTTEGSTEGSIEGAPEGTVEGGGEAEGEGASSPPDNCPDFSMASQRPAPLDSLESGVYGSDVFRNDDQRIEYFYGASEPIAVVRWWGVGLDMQFGASCERSNNAFIIRFYQGDPFTRGDLVSEQTVLATQEDTGEIVSNRVLYRHRAELDTPVTLFSGWIGIQGTGDSECSFYWYRSDEGSGDHIRVVSSPTTPGAGGDLSYCLLPSFDDPLPGHSADQNGDDEIILSELLRVVQLFNAGVFQCGTGTEDGYALGDADRECPPHAGDYNPRDWQFSLSELLRMIQFYSSGGFYECEPSEDGFCAGVQL